MLKIPPAVLMSLFLPILSAGCSTKYIPVPVDSELTRPVERPMLMPSATWRDLAESYALRGEAIDQCNAQLGAIRASDGASYRLWFWQ